MKIAFAGCGSLGSWTAFMLAGTIEDPPDFELFDDDRIEDTNLLTSPYMSHHD